MNGPEVSVVIPCYNRMGTVGRAVRSVLEQDFSDFEIIVVDDGSTDGSRDAVSSIRDPRLRLIHLSPNRGGGHARNEGVRQARGNLVAFLDSDDYWLPGKLSAQLRVALSAEVANFLVYNAVVWQEKGPGVVAPLRPFDAAKDDLSTYIIYEHNHMQTSGLLLPRRLALETPFDPLLRRHQDYDFVLCLREKQTRFLFCPEPNVIWTADAATGRISKTRDYAASYRWLKSSWNRLSWPARAEILAVRIGQESWKSAPLTSIAAISAGICLYPPVLARAIAKAGRSLRAARAA